MDIKFFEEKDNQYKIDDTQEYSQKSRPRVQIEVKFNGIPFQSIITQWLK